MTGEIIYCEICRTEFRKKTDTHSTCPKKECWKIAAEKKKRIAHWQKMKEIQERAEMKSAKEFRTTGIIKKAIVSEMVENYGHAYCEIC